MIAALGIEYNLFIFLVSLILQTHGWNWNENFFKSYIDTVKNKTPQARMAYILWEIPLYISS